MAIIIGDIHGNEAAARAFLLHKPEVTHVALGDLVDSRKKVGFESEAACLDLLLSSEAVLLWGNHDLAYLPERPWRCYGNYGELAFRQRYHLNRDRFLAAFAVDGWLCTHAGVSPEIATLVPAETIAMGVDAVACWLNVEFARQLQIRDTDVIVGEPRFGFGPLFNISVWRGGCRSYGGIFWFDAESEQSQPAPAVGQQIFGHSPVPCPERGNSYILNGDEVTDGPSWINMNATEDGIWVLDTATNEIVDLTSEIKSCP